MNKVRRLKTQTLVPGLEEFSPETKVHAVSGRRMALIDLDTSECLAVYAFDGKRKPKESDWIALYQRTTKALAIEWNLSGAAVRVLLYLISSVGYGNAAVVNQSKMAREFGLSNTVNISRALKELEARGIAHLVDRSKAGNTYRLNPNYGWKGERPQGKALQIEREARLSAKNNANQAGQEPVFLCAEKAFG